ncbi:zinc finger protein 16-like [Platysternon megacephalum]|uniref:Zinc finger protein 16-like n=1 Tax=Platysternon megacephalum TaxID=55544 RepID=A0A4D9DVE0_9SAUR|nr:zinc finger protein 16-like [Platysternon megacephalum]
MQQGIRHRAEEGNLSPGPGAAASEGRELPPAKQSLPPLRSTLPCPLQPSEVLAGLLRGAVCSATQQGESLQLPSTPPPSPRPLSAPCWPCHSRSLPGRSAASRGVDLISASPAGAWVDVVGGGRGRRAQPAPVPIGERAATAPAGDGAKEAEPAPRSPGKPEVLK